MKAEVTAFSFASLALVLSGWFYASGVSNRNLAIKTQRIRARIETLEPRISALNMAIQDQEALISATSSGIEKGRPAIVNETSTLADWNNNPALKELLTKHGYRDSSKQNRQPR